MKLWLKALLCVLAVNLLGSLGAVFTIGALGDWYSSLERPPGVPPNSVFGPVWTTLYVLMGISVALVWHRAPKGRARRRALGIFAGQMLLNILWTPIFFGIHQLGAALVVIVLLLVAIVATIRSFARQDRLAAWLLAPYLMWVCYASYLNAGFWWLNR